MLTSLQQINDCNAVPEHACNSAHLFFIIAPLKLLPQWIGKIQKIAPDIKIFKYHDDKKAQSVSEEFIIRNNLIKNHNMFNEDVDNTRSIIITTYETLISHHEVRAQQNWCVFWEHWNVNAAKQIKQEYDISWSGGLNNCFDTVVLNEAHLIKNSTTETLRAVQWIQSDFHLMLTATPLLAETKNFSDYLKLIESVNAEQLWSSENLRA